MGLKKWLREKFNSDINFEEESSRIANKNWIDIEYLLDITVNGLSKKDEKNRLLIIYNEVLSVFHDFNKRGSEVGEPDFGRGQKISLHSTNQDIHFLNKIDFERLAGFRRSLTFRIKKKGKNYRLVMRAKVPSKESKKNNLRWINKNEERVYGYSPNDFNEDKNRLFLLERDFLEHFNFPVKQPMFYTVFNKRGKPVVKYYSTILVMSYDIENRVKLFRENPSLERDIFLESLKSFINRIKEQNIRFKEKNTLKNKKWLVAVEKMLKISS